MEAHQIIVICMKKMISYLSCEYWPCTPKFASAIQSHFDFQTRCSDGESLRYPTTVVSYDCIYEMDLYLLCPMIAT